MSLQNWSKYLIQTHFSEKIPLDDNESHKNTSQEYM